MRTRILGGTAASAAAAVTLLCLPGLSLGGPLSDRAEPSQSVTVKPSAPAPRSTPLREARPSQATPNPPTGYIPPLHGTNPHGQGTAATIDLAPSPTRPLSEDPTGAGDPTSNREEIVLGRARGEQRADGRYHGHITILSLFGNEIAGVDTNPGETRDGPVESIQQGLLNPICTSSGGLICLQLLRAHSETTATSSSNQFRAANVRLGGAGAGGAALTANAAESNGNISSDGTCQTSHGDSTLTGLAIAVPNGATPQIQAATSSTDSRACRGQAPTQTNTSDVIAPNLQIPPILPAGCGSGGPGGTGTADTVGGIPVLLPIVCNADDTNGAQAGAPYGVREALAVFALVTPPDNALLKVTAAASESRAVAPADDGGDGDGDGGDGGGGRGGRGGDRDGGGGGGGRAGGGAGDGGGGAGGGGAGDGDGDGDAQREDGIDNDGDGKVDFPDDPQCSSSSDDSEADSLAFTGANLLLIVLMGAISLAVGLRLRRVANRQTPLA